MKDFDQKRGPYGAMTMTRSEPEILAQAEAKNFLNEKTIPEQKKLLLNGGKFFLSDLGSERKNFWTKKLSWTKKTIPERKKFFPQPRPADLNEQ